MSCYIGSKWETLGTRLGISGAGVENIKEDHKNKQADMIMEMLVTWRDSCDETDKLSSLTTALDKVGLKQTDQV